MDNYFVSYMYRETDGEISFGNIGTYVEFEINDYFDVQKLSDYIAHRKGFIRERFCIMGIHKLK